MKRNIAYVTTCFLYLCLCVLAPFAALADAENAPPTSEMSPIVITEVQTRNATVAQEFIELFNTTAQPVDISGWALWYMPAANGPDKLTSGNVVPLRMDSTISDEPDIIPAHGYYVLSDGNDYASANQTYAASQGLLADGGGNLWLVRPAADAACSFIPQDKVGWGNASHGAGNPVKAPAAGQSIERFITAAGQYVDTDNNATDFGVSTAAFPPTPATVNNLQAPLTAIPTAASGPEASVVDPTCTPPVPVAPSSGSEGAGAVDPTSTDDGLSPVPGDEPPATITTAVPDGGVDSVGVRNAPDPTLPIADDGLAPLRLTELLPNPAPPQTDAQDEFIELYNPNATTFDLSGFELMSGTTTKHHFMFGKGTYVPAHGFAAFFSADTGLGLSNSGGQVWLLDPFGNPISQPAIYGAAKDGQAWALANGAWYWTATPTPNAANVVTMPVAKSTKTPAAKPKNTTAAHTTVVAKARKAPSTDSPSTASLANAQLDSSVQAVPVHSYVLAITALFALLYGAYEYRHDLANKLYQLRCYRSARRKNRADAKGG